MDYKTAKFHGLTIEEFADKLLDCAGFAYELGKALDNRTIPQELADKFLISVGLPNMAFANALRGINKIMERRASELEAEMKREKEGMVATFGIIPSNTRS